MHLPRNFVRSLSCRLLVGGLLFFGSLLGAAPQAGSAQGYLLVANKGSRALSIVDPQVGRELAVIPEDGVTGHEVIASPDGRLAYVPIFGNAGVGKPGTDGQLIRVIDLEKRAIVATVDFGKGMRPHCPMIHPKTGELYVTTEIEDSVSIIDPKTLKVIGAIPTGKPEAHMLALSHDGKRGYTANVGSGTISVLNLEKRSLETLISVAPRIQRVSVSPDDRWVITADQTALRLAVIDARKNTVASSIALPGIGYGTAFTPDGKWLLVALPSIQKVGFIDWKKKVLVATVDVPKSPQNVLMRPDGARAYVSCDASAQVAEIDVVKQTVTQLIKVGPGADGLAWAAPAAR